MKSAGEILEIINKVQKVAEELVVFGHEHQVLSNEELRQYLSTINKDLEYAERTLMLLYGTVYARLELKDINKGKE